MPQGTFLPVPGAITPQVVTAAALPSQSHTQRGKEHPIPQQQQPVSRYHHVAMFAVSGDGTAGVNHRVRTRVRCVESSRVESNRARATAATASPSMSWGSIGAVPPAARRAPGADRWLRAGRRVGWYADGSRAPVGTDADWLPCAIADRHGTVDRSDARTMRCARHDLPAGSRLFRPGCASWMHIYTSTPIKIVWSSSTINYSSFNIRCWLAHRWTN
jgi:hypothetical protein